MPNKAKTVSESICQRHSCSKSATEKCKYCKELFCEEHSIPRLTGTKQYIAGILDHNIKREYEEEYYKEDGHPCALYTGVRLKELEKKYAAPSKQVRWEGGRSRRRPTTSNWHSEPTTPITYVPVGVKQTEDRMIAIAGIIVVIIIILVLLHVL